MSTAYPSPSPQPESQSSGPTPPQLVGPPIDLAQMDVFRSSDFPDHPTVPRSPFYEMAAQGIPDDPDVLLRAMYQQSRNPALLRLLSMREGQL